VSRAPFELHALERTADQIFDLFFGSRVFSRQAERVALITITQPDSASLEMRLRRPPIDTRERQDGRDDTHGILVTDGMGDAGLLLAERHQPPRDLPRQLRVGLLHQQRQQAKDLGQPHAAHWVRHPSPELDVIQQRVLQQLVAAFVPQRAGIRFEQ